MARTIASTALALLTLALAGTAVAQKGPKCAAGQRPSLSGCVDGSAQARVRVRPEAQPKEVGPKPVPKPDPDVIAERAKPTITELGSKALLIREIQQLETMLKRT